MSQLTQKGQILGVALVSWAILWGTFVWGRPVGLRASLVLTYGPALAIAWFAWSNRHNLEVRS